MVGMYLSIQRILNRINKLLTKLTRVTVTLKFKMKYRLAVQKTRETHQHFVIVNTTFASNNFSNLTCATIYLYVCKNVCIGERQEVWR